MTVGECCDFCGDPVNIKQAGNFIFVQGWEKVRHGNQGGGHGLTERKTLGKYACRDCMDKRERGINVNQTGMF